MLTPLIPRPPRPEVSPLEQLAQFRLREKYLAIIKDALEESKVRKAIRALQRKAALAAQGRGKGFDPNFPRQEFGALGMRDLPNQAMGQTHYRKGQSGSIKLPPRDMKRLRKWSDEGIPSFDMHTHPGGGPLSRADSLFFGVRPGIDNYIVEGPGQRYLGPDDTNPFENYFGTVERYKLPKTEERWTRNPASRVLRKASDELVDPILLGEEDFAPLVTRLKQETSLPTDRARHTLARGALGELAKRDKFDYDLYDNPEFVEEAMRLLDKEGALGPFLRMLEDKGL
jgi:hypothetical protein|tara:strand:- start:9121 stop:9975 length:855 start_codon:yes stop_codon:yes gene_type:complete